MALQRLGPAVVASIAGMCVSAAAQPIIADRASREVGQPRPALYVSMDSFNSRILVYDALRTDPHPRRIITQEVSLPMGMAVDSARNLYVTNEGYANVVVYPPGSGTPIMTYTADLHDPIAVALDASSHLYVVNATTGYSSPGNVVQFTVGKPFPSRVLTYPAFGGVESVAVDTGGDVFAGYVGSSGADVVEFPKGSSNGRALGLTLGNPRSMAFDGQGNLLVVDTSYSRAGEIKVFRLGRREPVRVFGHVGYPSAIAFDQSLQHLFVGDQQNNVVEVYSYPAAKLENLFARGMQVPNGLAVSPPAPL